MDWIVPNEPVDEETLREALEVVVGAAYQNGVDVERDWPCRGEDDPNWDVDIVQLASGGQSSDS